MSNVTSFDAKKSTVTLVEKKVKEDTSLVTNGTSSFPEDSFFGSYTTAQGGINSVSIIEPTFKPATLRMLTTTNNILGQCIEAMEVNVDGTGHTIELVTGMEEDEKQKGILTNFFDEPYPNKSMVSIRRELRADLESTGCGYLEIIRNAAREVMLMNHLPSDDMRLLRYDDPVPVERTITRGGKELKVTVRSRERRFIQIINGVKVYFKEFGASRDLDRDTGLWAPAGAQLPIEKQASEILYFTVNKDAFTPYGVPRWINQLPSVLGSRKSEEFNLEFFDSNGIPPVLILVQGGYLGAEVTKSLQNYLAGGKGSKHRAAIVEAIASSGSIDSAGTVKVDVQRFGCVDADTEVLTCDGWIPISSYDKQLVATMDNCELRYETPSHFHVYDYDGELVNLEGDTVSTLVTPNHRVCIENEDSKGLYSFSEADAVFSHKYVKLPTTTPDGKHGIPWDHISVLGTKCHTDFVLYCIGKYLNGVVIPEAYATILPIKGTLTATDLTWWLEQVCSVDGGTSVPPFLLHLPQEQSKRLLLSILGNNQTFFLDNDSKKYVGTYTFPNREAVDSLQILCLNSGYTSTVSKVYDSEVSGGIAWNLRVFRWRVDELHASKAQAWSKVYYAGKVYCFTMRTGVFITRRNGKVCITGNSERQQDCHSSDTEVLTSSGWKPFQYLLPTDAVATLNPATNVMEYHVPDEHVSYDFSGNMYSFENKGTSFCVTGNHDLWMRTRHGGYKKAKANTWGEGARVMTTAAVGVGAELQHITLPMYKRRVDAVVGTVGVAASDFLYFLGLYVGDGYVTPPVDEGYSTGGYSVQLGAKASDKIAEFKIAMMALASQIPGASYGVYAFEGGESVRITSKTLAMWLRNNVGCGAHTKTLPDWTLTLNRKQSQLLLDGLYSSDGAQCPGRNAWVYNTASKELASRVQIIALRAGCRASVVDAAYDANASYWRVNIVPGKFEVLCSDVPKLVPYTGKVYCVKVKNHLVFTRHNGKVLVSGNSMFQQYDKNCEDHVRIAFRLPPILLGRTVDYSYASASASYMVAEAQVFAPERLEFDERMWWIVKALGVRNYVFKSKPLTIQDVATDVSLLQMVSTNKIAKAESIVKETNIITGMNLEFQEPPKEEGGAEGAPAEGEGAEAPPEAPSAPPEPPEDDGGEGVGTDPTKEAMGASPKLADKAVKVDKVTRLVALANDWASALGLNGEVTMPPERVVAIKREVASLTQVEQTIFSEVLAMKSLKGVDKDLSGLSELCGCAIKLL